MKIMVETSARHIHVTKEAFAVLFGENATLTNKKDRSAMLVRLRLLSQTQESLVLPLLFVSQAISKELPDASLLAHAENMTSTRA